MKQPPPPLSHGFSLAEPTNDHRPRPAHVSRPSNWRRGTARRRVAGPRQEVLPSNCARCAICSTAPQAAAGVRRQNPRRGGLDLAPLVHLRTFILTAIQRAMTMQPTTAASVPRVRAASAVSRAPSIRARSSRTGERRNGEGAPPLPVASGYSIAEKLNELGPTPKFKTAANRAIRPAGHRSAPLGGTTLP
jgi:hypothetical protein